MNSMTIRVASPDRRIEATVVAGDRINVRFVSGTYQWYTERSLEHQLAGLLARAWDERRRYYFEALSEAIGETVRPDQYDEDPHRVAFRKARARLVCDGTSPGGWVRMESTGLINWRFCIRDGARRRLSPERFCQEVESAARSLLADHRAKTVALKDEHFDLRLPKNARD